MNYSEALKLAQSARNVDAGKPLACNTRLFMRDGGAVAMRLHKTDIATWFPDGSIVLNSGGWKTKTTKERLNDYTPARIYQARGVWTVHHAMTWDDERGYVGGSSALFKDGMTLHADGSITGGEEPSETQERERVTKAGKAYAKLFIDALYNGRVGAPSGGDCWACCMRTAEGETVMGDGHILEHIKEGYFVPSLLVNAMREFGASRAAEQTAHALMQGKPEYAYSKNRNDFLASQLQTMVKRYVLRHAGAVA